MSTNFSRKDTSILNRWWWTIDRWFLAITGLLLLVGMLLSFAGSPAVAQKLGLDTFYFVKRHFAMMIPCIGVMFLVSFLSSKNIRYLCGGLFIVGLLVLLATIFIGQEIKGARRWINIAGFSMQISEFIKPVFSVVIAWALAEGNKNAKFPGFASSAGLLGVFVGLLLLQPDFGMSIVVVAAWVAQLFVAGLHIMWLVALGGVGIIGFLGAYFLFPHVARRVDQFLDPSSCDTSQDLYQVSKSLDAFMSGGIFGKGPGEGLVKKYIPDVHADFIFAVAGEEFGFLFCVLIVGMFAFLITRSLLSLQKESSIFTILAVIGIMVQFCLQAVINMASSLHLIPTKGMTLPFISYGGSSILALGFAMGILISLLRKQHGIKEAL